MKRLKEIDLLKGLAIISVILIHTIPVEIRVLSFAQLHFWQAVPIFVVLIGITNGLSFRKKNIQSLKQAYFSGYFLKKAKRFLLPVTVIFFVSLFYCFLVGREPTLGLRSFLGYFPIWGPGNYFVPLLFQIVLFFPIIFLAFERHPKLTLVFSFLASLLFETNLQNLKALNSFLGYKANIFHFLFAIALGLFLSKDLNLLSKRNRLIIIGGFFSFLYLFAWRFGLTIPFVGSPNWINLFAFFYTAFLILVGVFLLKSDWVKKRFSFLAQIGLASFHIFLFQIFFFGAGFHLSKWAIIPNGLHHIYPVPLLGLATVAWNVLICVLFGFLWFKSESFWKKKSATQIAKPF